MTAQVDRGCACPAGLAGTLRCGPAGPTPARPASPAPRPKRAEAGIQPATASAGHPGRLNSIVLKCRGRPARGKEGSTPVETIRQLLDTLAEILLGPKRDDANPDEEPEPTLPWWLNPDVCEADRQQRDKHKRKH